MKIGVLALQGAFREHCLMLEACGATAIEVRKPEQLAEIDGLVLPGGESTTMGKLMVEWGLDEAIRAKAAEGMAIYGTCAGMIMLAKEIEGSDQPRLGLMDTTAVRNAFGRQRESFEADLVAAKISAEPIKAVFIRAPYLKSVGPEVEVLASVGEKVVIARQGKMLVSAFHPELTEDQRLHRYFLQMAKQ